MHSANVKQTLTVLAGLGHVQEQRLRVQLCRVEDRLQASEPPSSAAPMLPTEVHLPADDYPEDEYLSPTIYDDEKTEISTVPPPRRKKSRRRPPPEALTEVAETEVTRQPESYRTPVKRTRSDNRAGGHRRIEPEPDTPSSRKSQKDVYAEWGEPLQ